MKSACVVVYSDARQKDGLRRKDEVTGSILVISSKIPTVHHGYLILKNGQTSGLTKER